MTTTKNLRFYIQPPSKPLSGTESRTVFAQLQNLISTQLAWWVLDYIDELEELYNS